MKKIALPVVLVSALALSGCVISIDDDDFDGDYYPEHTSWQQMERDNREHIAALVLGTSTQSVIDEMGAADFNEALQKGDAQYQVLWYRTQRRDGDGMTTKDECTPLVFKNGELMGWGDTALQNI
jgi:hypothetical protein